MNTPVPTRTLRENPDLNQLKRQAKDLLGAFLAGEAAAVKEVNSHYRDPDASAFALHNAQLVLARSYGFDSWPKLKAYVDGVTVKRLAEAARAGDIEQVRAMLRVRPELVKLTVADDNEHTALHHAVLGRSPHRTVRVLMQHGANARAGIYPHRDATSALTIATERGYDEIVAIIREEEHRQTADDLPAGLVEAINAGDETKVIAILERHPELVQAQNLRNGWTFLHVASATLHKRLAVRLLDRGADVNWADKHGLTPLEALGRRCGAAEKAERLTTVAELLRARGAALTPRSAVILGDAEFLRTRRAEHAELLTLAAEYDRPEILKLLLDLGLDPDARVRVPGIENVTFTWGMPLWHCARHGKHAMAEMLLERGADPNGQVYASGTPVSEAFGQRDEKMIALLERYGGRSTPVMAGQYRRPDLARKLLTDSLAGQTVAEQLLWGAACGGEPEILRMALERVDWPPEDSRWYPVLTQPLRFWNHSAGPWCHHEWDRSTYLTCFRLLLERCGPPNGRLRFGLTLLHEVVASRDHLTPEERVEFAKLLLDAGARMDVRDDLLKSTPLGWACRWGRLEMINLLLERGADPVEADAEPWATPTSWAKKRKHEAALEVLAGQIATRPPR